MTDDPHGAALGLAEPMDEGAPVTVTATVSAALGSAVTVPLALTAGTAEPGDYGPLSSITINAGSTTGTGHYLHEPGRRHRRRDVHGGAGQPALVGHGGQPVVGDSNDHEPLVSLSASPNPVDEERRSR